MLKGVFLKKSNKICGDFADIIYFCDVILLKTFATDSICS